MDTEQESPKILCVDDEPNVLSAIKRNLIDQFDITTATSGEEGLQILQARGPFAVVLSDMRMPNMDGATFLEKARGVSPNTVRMLLTGQTDLNSAIAAVNEGQIFRFLTKPCPNHQLAASLAAAIQQHALITAERELLEKTLLGSIKALTDVLSLVNPTAFGRAQRIRQHALHLADKQGLPERWVLDVSAMLSQLGLVTLPEHLLQKINTGKPLTPEEQSMLHKSAAVTERLLANIPRIEHVRWILGHYLSPLSALPDSHAGTCAKILRIAADFEALEERDIPAPVALHQMKIKEGCYDPALLTTFTALLGGAEEEEIKELYLRQLCVGMIIAQELRNASGMLLVARGYEITPTFLERARNFTPGTIKEPILIKIRRR